MPQARTVSVQIAAQKTSRFWDFFGPTVFALAPLVLLVLKHTKAWRMPIMIWFLSSVEISFASGLPRFLLAVFPLALSCIAAGLEGAFRRKWILASRAASAVIAFVILLGIAGLSWYSRKPVLASVGLIDNGKYLEETSRDYQLIEFVNRTLGKRDSGGKVLVLLRHLYYLEAPYLTGDPASGFEVDPAHLQSAREWKSFFAGKHIAYVVRSPDYPRALAEPLLELEKSGELVPFAETEVQTFRESGLIKSQ